MMKKIIYFGLLALLLTSCSEDYHTSDACASPLLVSGVCTGSPSTRSTTLGTGSMIGISRIADGAYTAQNNYKYVNTSGVWSATASKILLVSNNNATLCAYSPYSSSVDVSSVSLTSGLYSAASDFCYGYKSGVNAINMGTGVSFTLDHAYAKLTLRFTKGSSFAGTGDVKKITVTGGASSGTLNLSGSSPSLNVTDAITPVIIGNGTTTIFNTVISSPSYDVEVLMVPSVISSGLTFTLNVDGTDKTATLNASLLSGALAAKTNYTIPISINTTSMLDLGGASGTNYVSITDWTVPSSVTNPLESTDITNIQPESNSYIVAPGSTIYIPVSRATAGNVANFPSGASFTTGLLWSDVDATHVTATAVGRYIKVVAGSTEGNSVVFAKSTTSPYNIVWSWHIWVTNYNPGLTANTDANTTTYSFNGNLWMDRNLGATTTTPATVTTFGLLYQWGRKDPFPGSSSYDDNVEPTLFGAQTSVTKTAAPTGPNLVVSIQNPLTFYYSDGDNSDWYASGSGPQNDALWYDGTATKTLYDPCPVGWRVPFFLSGTTSPWDGLSTTGATWSSGFIWSDIGYYPASGLRYGSSGSFSGVGTDGGFWSSSVDRASGYFLSFNSDDVDPATSYYRAFGFSVRCVKN
jgi:hypothetical protein